MSVAKRGVFMMTVDVDGLAQEIRDVIKRSKGELVKNRNVRMKLISDIRTFKNNIKRGEALCSRLETSTIDCSYVRDDLKKKRDVLNSLRVSLVQEELNYAIERSRCKILHEQLDRLKLPFEPAAVSRRG